jgi:hypothetical protein
MNRNENEAESFAGNFVASGKLKAIFRGGHVSVLKEKLS